MDFTLWDIVRNLGTGLYWTFVLSLAAFAGGGLAGLLVLAYCGLELTGSTPSPGTAALLPVLATVAVIAVGMPSSRFSPRWLIDRRVVQWTGDISYPLYLWHWPLLTLGRYPDFAKTSPEIPA